MDLAAQVRHADVRHVSMSRSPNPRGSYNSAPLDGQLGSSTSPTAAPPSRDMILRYTEVLWAETQPARIHATGVVRELTSNGGGILTQSWSGWTMSVQDEHGAELFSLVMSDFGNGNSGK
jgi:hypothetical protein